MLLIGLARHKRIAVHVNFASVHPVPALEHVLSLHTINGIEHPLNGRVVISLKIGMFHRTGADALGDPLGDAAGNVARVGHASLVGLQNLLASVLSRVE